MKSFLKWIGLMLKIYAGFETGNIKYFTDLKEEEHYKLFFPIIGMTVIMGIIFCVIIGVIVYVII